MMKRNRYQFIRYDDYPAILDSKRNRVASFLLEDNARWLVDRLNAGDSDPDIFEWVAL